MLLKFSAIPPPPLLGVGLNNRKGGATGPALSQRAVRSKARIAAFYRACFPT